LRPVNSIHVAFKFIELEPGSKFQGIQLKDSLNFKYKVK